jgi:AcrR family transcriptional regulator
LGQVTGEEPARAPGRRLPKADRRAQLLDVALMIVREEGADSLTLGHLAVRAGVSKPIAYEHFGTRAGLLIALYRSIDAAQVEALRQALLRAPRELREAAELIARAYMRCYADSSGEWHAVASALKGSEAMEAVQQELLDGYVDLFRTALVPYSPGGSALFNLRCVGLVGAAEAISREMVRGKVDEKAAASALAELIVRSVAAR